MKFNKKNQLLMLLTTFLIISCNHNSPVGPVKPDFKFVFFSTALYNKNIYTGELSVVDSRSYRINLDDGNNEGFGDQALFGSQPNGGIIYFLEISNGSSTRFLCSSGLEGNNVTRLLNYSIGSRATPPVVNSDETYLAYTTGTLKDSLIIMNLNNYKTFCPFYTTSTLRNPIFSDDNQNLAFIEKTYTFSTVHNYNFASKENHIIFLTVDTITYPSFGADGNIYIIANSAGKTTFYQINPTTEKSTKLCELQGQYSHLIKTSAGNLFFAEYKSAQNDIINFYTSNPDGSGMYKLENPNNQSFYLANGDYVRYDTDRLIVFPYDYYMAGVITNVKPIYINAVNGAISY